MEFFFDLRLRRDCLRNLLPQKSAEMLAQTMNSDVDSAHTHATFGCQFRPGITRFAAGKKSFEFLELLALLTCRIFPPQLSHGSLQNSERPAPFKYGLRCQLVSRFEPISGFGLAGLQRERGPTATTALRSGPLPFIGQKVLQASQQKRSEFARLRSNGCDGIWYPLYAFIRRQGSNPHEAEDLTQEFFSRFLCFVQSLELARTQERRAWKTQ
jgi:hypothetical protein